MTDNSSAIESLLEAKFKPRRSVVLAFGFDEESSGFQVSFSTHVFLGFFLKRNTWQGAGTLGPTLESAYGENGFAMIVDEGCKMTSYSYFTLDTKRKVLGFSYIHWKVWFHHREPRDCGERKHKCPSGSHGPRRSLEYPASPHGIRYFVVLATYIHLIAIIPTEHWHPLCAPCTLRAEPLQGRACKSSQTIFSYEPGVTHSSHREGMSLCSLRFNALPNMRDQCHPIYAVELRGLSTQTEISKLCSRLSMKTKSIVVW